MAVNILVVEDEDDIRRLMILHLGREGYQITEASSGALAYEILGEKSFDLVILDWMLPGLSGLELLKTIRKEDHLNKQAPVLFVTAKSESENIVLALESGADDYIVKPFDFKVFLARVKSLLRRGEASKLFNEKDILSVGDLSLDQSSHRVFIKDKEINLTLSEFLLLKALLMNQGKVLSRHQLASRVQGEDTNVTARTIDTHTSVLRKKIEPYGKLIETVRGVGYRIGYLSDKPSSMGGQEQKR